MAQIINPMTTDERIRIIREGRNILHECENNKIRATLTQTPNGKYYAVMLFTKESTNGMFRRTEDKKKAQAVYRKIEQHILNGGRRTLYIVFQHTTGNI